MIDEKRATPRRPLHHAGKLLIAPRHYVDCKLSNVSEAGARIEVADPGTLPDRFLLLLAPRGPVRRTCQVVWREADHVGVKFVRATAKRAKKRAAPPQPTAESVAVPVHAEPELAEQD